MSFNSFLRLFPNLRFSTFRYILSSPLLKFPLSTLPIIRPSNSCPPPLDSSFFQQSQLYLPSVFPSPNPFRPMFSPSLNFPHFELFPATNASLPQTFSPSVLPFLNFHPFFQLNLPSVFPSQTLLSKVLSPQFFPLRTLTCRQLLPCSTFPFPKFSIPQTFPSQRSLNPTLFEPFHPSILSSSLLPSFLSIP